MNRKSKRVGLIVFQIRPQVAKMLKKFTARGMSTSKIINEALHQYLIEKEFRQIRKKLIPFAQAEGVFTDKDVKRLLK